MEKIVASYPNNCIVVICEKNDNRNNTYTLLPVEVSLGKIDEKGIFISEDKNYKVPSCTNSQAIQDSEEKYVYALCISLDEIKEKYAGISEIGSLLALYYRDSVKDLLLVVTDDVQTKLYRTSYDVISPEIVGGKDKLINESPKKIEPEKQSVNIIPNQTSLANSKINLPALEKYVKERVLENDDVVEDICTTISLNFSATNPREMQSLLSVGGTGTGKTETFRAISEFVGIPLVVFDCNTLTATGYVGDDIKDILRLIYTKSTKDMKLAERSILLLDEIDKLAARGHNVTDVGAQQLLLKFYDGGTYSFESAKNSSPLMMDVSFITKAAAGAFPELFEQRRKSENTGFRVASKRSIYQEKITAEELEKFGMISELVGRWFNIFMYKEQTEDSLVRILHQSKNSPLLLKIQRYEREFNCDLDIAEEFYREFARKALKNKTGARCLDALMAETFKRLDHDLKCELDSSGSNAKRIVRINGDIIHNPRDFKL